MFSWLPWKDCLSIHKKPPFQTLNCISTEKNQTVVFPLPIDLVDGLLGTNKNKEVLEADEDTAEA